MTIVEERQALYRSLILAAAEREFARVGFGETKVTDIAQAADLSLATVYKTFSGKEEIWNEVHSQRIARLLALAEAHMAGVDSPLERLLAGIAATATFLTDNQPYLELNLRTATGWLTAAGTTGLQRTVWAEGLDMIAAGVEAARAAGELGTLRPRLATGMIISALQVWLADWIDSEGDRDAAVVVADLITTLRRLLTEGRP